MNTRLKGFGTSIFSEMTQLANKYSATNLGQGFPNFNPETSSNILQNASKAILHENRNQYCRSFGALELTKAIGKRFEKFQGVNYNFESEITVFSGATEAIFATFCALLEVGDEVIIFEPHYDSYRPAINSAGGRERVVTLKLNSNRTRFSFDKDELRAAFNPKTKAILINSPHNPTGTVFSREELQMIADLSIEHNCIVVSDEVYENILFDGLKHVSIASLSNMRNRTISISSAGKTFSVTGWKIGWALASPELSEALRTAHQFITFSSATPFQYAIAKGLELEDDFFLDLISMYQQKRDRLCNGLKKAGFDVFKPQGTYFVQVDIEDFLPTKKLLGKNNTDLEFCKWLVQNIGVCGIPTSAFYSSNSKYNYVRFAFCKTDDVIDEAIHRLITRL